MTKLFISHKSKDDEFVRELRMALERHEQDGWIDSCQLRRGDPLWPEIQKAIDDASAFAVVVSSDALQSDWVDDELAHALEVQRQRGRHNFPIILLLLNGTKLGAFKNHVGGEPVCISVRSPPGGVDAAVDSILVALVKRLPSDAAVAPQPEAELIEELVLELTDLSFQEQDGVRRPSAHARLVYEPATSGQRHVQSTQPWRFVAPLGPIEAEELRWYLEKYAIWPSEYFRGRARKVEGSLVQWGQLLHQAALPMAHTANVMHAWAQVDHAGRRFSVSVDARLEAGAADSEVQTARQVCSLLLGLPWELLHNGDSFLFQGAKPTRVRRRLPNREVPDVPVVNTPIRILLVTARPEDDACGYIDHRASALPLVEATEALGGLVRVHVLSPPTLAALSQELDHARSSREPYHVVHFDGHGVYDRQVGKGGLCFEDPQDLERLEKRRHVTVYTEQLGPLLLEHRVPLVFLDACQTAQAESASESVASELLKAGVASVVAMSHSVLVETARRFVQAFYAALAHGARVGHAMLEGQRQLKDDNFRGRIFGEGELRLDDWFVPVLFQEKADPQLFSVMPARQTQDDVKSALKARMGALPDEPDTGFIGRSRELLALQRLLRHDRYAVVRGQGGEGKTALAAEFARWMVRSQQIRRAAFVSVEEHSHVAAVLDTIGRQLVPGYSVATHDDLDIAILPVERALGEQPTLLVLDNMESILLPLFVERPEALSVEANRELGAILRLCSRLNAKGDTRLLFTSREALPKPFDSLRHRRELHQLAREDAVKLVERALNQQGAGAGAAGEATANSIEQLVDAVHCHARTLALLGPSLSSRGVDETCASLVELMTEMERKFPGSREKSVFASVALSLRRMSPANHRNSLVLGVFHGGFQLRVLRDMTKWETADVDSLARELIETGLATPNRYDHLTLNPALCPYLCMHMESAEREELTARWSQAMLTNAVFLVEQQNQNAELVATLTGLDLPNFFALFDQVQRAGDLEVTIALATALFALMQFVGNPRLLARVTQVRDSVAAALGETWNHWRFVTQRTRTQQQLDNGHLREAFDGAQELLQLAMGAGVSAYSGADYDLAIAFSTLARVSTTVGRSEQALQLFEEARQRFEAIVRVRPNRDAERMISVCCSDRGHCLKDLGRFDEAAVAYSESISLAGRYGDDRGVAIGKGSLGTIRLNQRRYQEALEAYEAAVECLARLDEPGSVAHWQYRIGLVYQEAGHPERAEDFYRESLATRVRLGDVGGQAESLEQLGKLYDAVLNRVEDAIAFHRKAADMYFQLGDSVSEGSTRRNLGLALVRLGRLDEARHEVLRGIECKKKLGDASEPWLDWATLAKIEADTANYPAASEAKRKATDYYLDYRRNGGQNNNARGVMCRAVTQLLLDGKPTAASSLQKIADQQQASALSPFIQTLQAIVAGNRDRTLAEASGLDYMMAAEVLFLIETLEKRG